MDNHSIPDDEIDRFEMDGGRIMKLEEMRCTPCAGGVPPLSHSEVHKKMSELPGWEVTDNGRRIERMYKFHDFVTARAFIDRVAVLAEDQQHHPDICFGWAYARISFQTHSINGLHDNDFIMASKVDQIAHEHVYAAEMR